MVYVGVYLVAISHLVGAAGPLGSQERPAALDTEQTHALALLRIEAFDATFSAGLLLFALHLLDRAAPAAAATPAHTLESGAPA